MGRILIAFAFALALAAQHPSGGNASSGAGSGAPYYEAAFSAVTTVTVTAASHGQGTKPVSLGCFDNATPRAAIALSAGSPTIAANGDMVFAWSGSKTGACYISSSGATGTAGGALTGTYPNPSLANNAVTTAKIADDQVTAAKLAAADKTGNGAKVVTAASTPADGCAQFASGNLASTGSACGAGGGGAVSSVYGRTGAVTAQSGDYTGSQVANTPAGAIAATTVQAALNELDTEKQAALGFTPENSANRGAANGYAPLDAGSRVPAASLGSGTANGSTFLAGDQTYKSVTGQVQVQNDGVNQGSPRSVIDFLPFTGGSWAISDNGSKILVQGLIDFATVASINAVQDGELDSCVATGTNSLSCAPTKPWSGTPPNGAFLKVRSPNAASAAVTITVSALGPYKALKQDRSTQLTSGDWAANGTHTFVVDSTADAGGPAFICQSCAGGGSAPAPSDDTYANRPTCNAAATGTIFHASDITAKHWICDGSTWRAYAFGMLLTEPPAAATWTTVVSSGGGSPTVTDVGGAIRYVGGSSGGSAIVTAVPGSTPYSLVLAYTSVAADDNGQYLAHCAFVLTDGTSTSSNRITSGILDISNVGGQVDLRFHSNRWTNIATYSSTQSKKVAVTPGMPPIMRYRDDGTNRYFELWDGSGWLTALSETRTTFLTATHYGFTCDSNKGSATLYHWKP